MVMEDKQNFLITFNFIMFPLALVIYNVFFYTDQSTILEYVNPTKALCMDGYIRKENLCYLAECEKEPCKTMSITCPKDKYFKFEDSNDTNCYTMLYFMDPVEPICPDLFIRSGPICIPKDDSKYDDTQEKLICAESRVMKNDKCYKVFDLVAESCPEGYAMEKGLCKLKTDQKNPSSEIKCPEGKSLINKKCYRLK